MQHLTLSVAELVKYTVYCSFTRRLYFSHVFLQAVGSKHVCFRAASRQDISLTEGSRPTRCHSWRICFEFEGVRLLCPNTPGLSETDEVRLLHPHTTLCGVNGERHLVSVHSCCVFSSSTSTHSSTHGVSVCLLQFLCVISVECTVNTH